MITPEKPDAPPKTEEYGKADSVLFQAWLVLFLMCVCVGLVNYLLMNAPW